MAVTILGKTTPLPGLPQPKPLGASTPNKTDPMTLWHEWKTDPTPERAGTLLTAAKPWIAQGLAAYADTHSPVIRGQAKLLALDAFKSYDPSLGSLRNHVFGRLQRLQRTAAQAAAAIRGPEGVVLDQQHLRDVSTNLEEKLGRSPTLQELSDASKMSPKRISHVMQYKSGIPQGSLFVDDGSGDDNDSSNDTQEMSRDYQQAVWQRAWLQAVQPHLDPVDRALVHNIRRTAGQKTNTEMARALGMTSAAISQRTARLQKMLHQFAEEIMR